MPSVGVARAAPPRQDTFNLIGYSWGAAVAARTALLYASSGVEVDFLGLIGALVNASLLWAVQSEPLIKNVGVINLTDHGDPIFAGMNDVQIITYAPLLVCQMLEMPAGSGHFYYSDSGTSDSMSRKRNLVALLIGMGLE